MEVQRILDQYDVPRMLGFGAFGALTACIGAHGAVHMAGVPNSYSAFLWLTPMAAVKVWLFLHSQWLARTQSRPHGVVRGGQLTGLGSGCGLALLLAFYRVSLLVFSFWPDI